MSLRNYIDETYLKGFCPELNNFKWTIGGTAEADFSKQKASAESIVANDFVGRGYKLRLLRTPLWLREAGTSATATTNHTKLSEDKVSRLRWVINVATLSGTTNTVVLAGTDDDSSETYTTLLTTTLTTTGEITGTFSKAYKFYRATTGINSSWVDYESYLVNSTYDNLYARKWLELIFIDASKGKDNQYWQLGQDNRSEYGEIWKTTQFDYDEDESGETSDEELKQTTSTRISAG